MASFSFGGERLRGFCNAGVYGVIFVYGKNAPWTGAAPDADAIQSNPMLEMVIDPMATHQDYFLHESDSLSPPEKGTPFITTSIVAGDFTTCWAHR